MMLYRVSGTLLFLIVFVSPFASSTCPNHALLGCVLRLKAQRVPFEKNMMNVVFNIATEAKLLRTCRVYSATMPCFREKIVECGDEKQRRILEEVGRMLMFICSPFSLTRQRQLIKHQRCISAVMNLPATTECPHEPNVYANDLAQCRDNCASRPSNFLCTMQTWISEQNVCTLQSLQSKCGADAANLYEQMQVTVFEPHFPLICDHVNHTKESTVPYTNTTTTTLPAIDLNSTPSSSKKTQGANTTSGGAKKTSSAPVVTKQMSIKPTKTIKHTMTKVTPTTTTTGAKPPPTSTYGSDSIHRLRETVILSNMSQERREEGAKVNSTANSPSKTPLPPWMTTSTSATTNWEVYSSKPSKKSYKAQYKEWNKPKMSFMHPMHQSVPETEISSTPRTIKVINLLKRFLPEYLPSLTNFFETDEGSSTTVQPQPIRADQLIPAQESYQYGLPLVSYTLPPFSVQSYSNPQQPQQSRLAFSRSRIQHTFSASPLFSTARPPLPQLSFTSPAVPPTMPTDPPPTLPTLLPQAQLPHQPQLSRLPQNLAQPPPHYHHQTFPLPQQQHYPFVPPPTPFPPQLPPMAQHSPARVVPMALPPNSPLMVPSSVGHSLPPNLQQFSMPVQAPIASLPPLHQSISFTGLVNRNHPHPELPPTLSAIPLPNIQRKYARNHKAQPRFITVTAMPPLMQGVVPIISLAPQHPLFTAATTPVPVPSSTDPSSQPPSSSSTSTTKVVEVYTMAEASSSAAPVSSIPPSVEAHPHAIDTMPVIVRSTAITSPVETVSVVKPRPADISPIANPPIILKPMYTDITNATHAPDSTVPTTAGAFTTYHFTFPRVHRTMQRTNRWRPWYFGGPGL